MYVKSLSVGGIQCEILSMKELYIGKMDLVVNTGVGVDTSASSHFGVMSIDGLGMKREFRLGLLGLGLRVDIGADLRIDIWADLRVNSGTASAARHARGLGLFARL